MAREVGFEPTTYGLEDRCSVQLSYPRRESFCIAQRTGKVKWRIDGKELYDLLCWLTHASVISFP